LTDLQNSFTAAKSTKFPTKPILSYHHTLNVLLHYLGKLKNQKFALLLHVKNVSNVTFCDFLSSIQQIKEMPNVAQINTKINAMQNIIILLFVRSVSLTTLKLCS